MASELSSYELQRLHNVERNNEQLRAMGIEPIVKTEASSATIVSPIKKRVHRSYGSPSRASARVSEGPSVIYDEAEVYRRMLASIPPPPKKYARQHVSGVRMSDEDEEDEEHKALMLSYHEEHKALMLSYQWPLDQAAVVDEVGGLRLHKSLRSSTGYRGVMLSPGSTSRYQACLPHCFFLGPSTPAAFF